MPQCPSCRGNKTLLAMLPFYASHVPIAERKAAFDIPCPTCGGEGEVSQQKLNAIRAGQILRDKRKAMGYGLRECAEALGMSPSALSNAEQGNESHSEIDRLYFAVKELPQRTPIARRTVPPAAAE